MKTWLEYHAERRLSEGAEDLIVKAYGAMGAADKEKVNQVLASPTWGDRWMNAMRATLTGKENLQPQQLAAIVLDGIDSYLSTGVSTSGPASGRIARAATQRQAAGQTTQANQPRADYQGNFGKTQTLWGSTHAQHGDVPATEIRAKGLHLNHHDVYNGPGGLATAPSSYKYVYVRAKNKIVYNPNYAG